MFFKRKKDSCESLNEQVERLSKKVENDSLSHSYNLKIEIEKVKKMIAGTECQQLVTCDKFGCAVIKNDAIRGESYVGRKNEESGFYSRLAVEYIVERYYCKQHAPLSKEDKAE